MSCKFKDINEGDTIRVTSLDFEEEEFMVQKVFTGVIDNIFNEQSAYTVRGRYLCGIADDADPNVTIEKVDPID